MGLNIHYFDHTSAPARDEFPDTRWGTEDWHEDRYALMDHTGFGLSYSIFNDLRTWIVEQAGLETASDPTGRKTPAMWKDDDPGTDYEGNWTREPEDPIAYLIQHSDCDGHIEPEHAGLIAERLKGLEIDATDEKGVVDPFYPTWLAKLIEICETAAATNRRLEFR